MTLNFIHITKNNTMDKIKQRRYNEYIGDLQVIVISDIFKGEVLDTEIRATEQGVICCISGIECDNFINDINDVIKKYRI